MRAPIPLLSLAPPKFKAVKFDGEAGRGMVFGGGRGRGGRGEVCASCSFRFGCYTVSVQRNGTAR